MSDKKLASDALDNLIAALLRAALTAHSARVMIGVEGSECSAAVGFNLEAVKSVLTDTSADLKTALKAWEKVINP